MSATRVGTLAQPGETVYKAYWDQTYTVVAQRFSAVFGTVIECLWSDGRTTVHATPLAAGDRIVSVGTLAELAEMAR